VHPLFVVDQEREEIDPFPGILHRGRHQDHRVSVTDEDGRVRLLGEFARLEGEGPPPKINIKRMLHVRKTSCALLTCPLPRGSIPRENPSEILRRKGKESGRAPLSSYRRRPSSLMSLRYRSTSFDSR